MTSAKAGSDVTVRLTSWDAEHRQIQVVADPMATVLTSLVENFGPLAHRMPPKLRQRAMSAGRYVAVPMLLHLAGSGSDLRCPDFLNGDGRGFKFSDQVDYIRELSGEVLERDLTAHPRVLPTSLASRRRTADRLLAEYCGQLTRYWQEVVSLIYPRLERRLSREVARFEFGLAVYGSDTMLNLFHPRVSLSRGEFTIRNAYFNGPRVWTPDVLILKPMVATPRTTFSNIGCTEHPDTDRAFFGASTLHLTPDQPRSGSGQSPLQLLLGARRSQILQSLKRRPGTTTDLADELILSPSATSHHLKSLLRAHVISRRRRGQDVYYALTDRGRQLMAIND